MKNIYASILASTALLLVGTVDAQSVSSAKTTGMVRSNNFLNPVAVPHHLSSDALRGGGAPINDGCGSVSTVVLPLGGSITFTGDNTGATEDGDYVAGSGLEGFGPVVWHKFSLSGCASLSVAYCGTDPAYQNLAAFLAETCPATDESYILFASGEFDSCGDGNGTINFTNVPAGEYYLPVLLDPSNSAEGPYTIQVSAVACPAPPANDECAGAISLTSGTSCDLTYFNTIGATQSMDAVNCAGAQSPSATDVWFSFVATSTEQSIGVVGFNAADAVIELFSGPCGDLTSIGCADNTFPADLDESTTEVIDQTGLTVGTTYYFRVYGYPNIAATFNFAGCVTEGSGNNVGISELQKSTVLSVYPNPGTGNFNMSYTGTDGMGTIAVLDLTGRVVYNAQSQFLSGTTRSLDLSGLAQGQYTIRLTMNGVRTQQSLVIR